MVKKRNRKKWHSFSWGTCFCWKRMERNGRIQKYQSCKATAGDSRYLTHCLKHTAVFPHEFYSPKHSEEHTADNTCSIIHSVPNFISSLFLSVHTHTLALYHTHIQNARWCCLPSNRYLKHAPSRTHTLNTHVKPWKHTCGQTALRFPREAPWMCSFRREVYVMPFLSRHGAGDGWRVRLRGGRISSYWRGTGRRGAQNSKYFKMIGDINSRLILSYTLWSCKISVWWFITATVSDMALKNSPLKVNMDEKESRRFL